MQFTKILFFIMLIATGVTPLYGMFIPKTLAQRLDDKNLSEQATLKILQETEDYEQVIIQEKEDFRGLLVSAMLRSGQKIPSHLYVCSSLLSELVTRNQCWASISGY